MDVFFYTAAIETIIIQKINIMHNFKIVKLDEPRKFLLADDSSMYVYEIITLEISNGKTTFY